MGELVGTISKMTKSEALKLEYRIRQVPVCKKNFELTKGRIKCLRIYLRTYEL